MLWTYEDMSKNWAWLGTGHTTPCTIIDGKILQEEKSLYSREEQFNGPEEDMRTYLNDYFSDLVASCDTFCNTKHRKAT